MIYRFFMTTYRTQLPLKVFDLKNKYLLGRIIVVFNLIAGTLEGSSISTQNLNNYIETLHLSRTQFYHLPGSHRQTGFLKNHPLSLAVFPFFILFIAYNFICVIVG